MHQNSHQCRTQQNCDCPDYRGFISTGDGYNNGTTIKCPYYPCPHGLIEVSLHVCPYYRGVINDTSTIRIPP